MALYEHIFLVRQDVTAQQVEALTEQIKTKIAGLGGAARQLRPTVRLLLSGRLLRR